MATTTRTYVSAASLEALQSRLNFYELTKSALVQSLEAVTEENKKVTKAVYEIQENSKKSGKVKLVGGGANTAWINDVKTNVSITRP